MKENKLKEKEVFFDPFFIIGKIYILTIDLNGRILTYEGKILKETIDNFEFIDKYGNKLGYNKKYFASKQEVHNE